MLEYQTENFFGVYDFRCRKHQDFFVDSHLHEYSEILYVHRGNGDLSVNGKAIRMPEKTMIYLPPNVIHEYYCTHAEVWCAVFSNDFIPAFFQELGGERTIPAPVAVGELLPVMEALFSEEEKGKMRLAGLLNLLLEQIVKESVLTDADQGDSVLYQKVISYLSEHFREEVTLSEVAEAFGYHPKYLSAKLHGLTKMHFCRLLSLYRIGYARTLLEKREADMTITRVADESGFSSLCTFHRAFRELVGMTPSEYRDRHS